MFTHLKLWIAHARHKSGWKFKLTIRRSHFSFDYINDCFSFSFYIHAIELNHKISSSNHGNCIDKTPWFSLWLGLISIIMYTLIYILESGGVLWETLHKLLRWKSGNTTPPTAKADYQADMSCIVLTSSQPRKLLVQHQPNTAFTFRLFVGYLAHRSTLEPMSC